MDMNVSPFASFGQSRENRKCGRPGCGSPRAVTFEGRHITAQGDAKGGALGYVHLVTVTARRLIPDAALALTLLAGTEVITFTGSGRSLIPLWVRALLAAVMVVSLAWRRRTPVTAWAISAAATAAAIACASLPGPGVLATLIALFTVASLSGRGASVTAGALSLAGCAILAITGSRL
jgi:hypothetical protein